MYACETTNMCFAMFHSVPNCSASCTHKLSCAHLYLCVHVNDNLLTIVFNWYTSSRFYIYSRGILPRHSCGVGAGAMEHRRLHHHNLRRR